MKCVTICTDMDIEPPKGDGWLAHVLWLSSGVLMAMLASLWSLLRETPSGVAIPRRVFLTAIIGGILSGVFTMALLLHIYDWEHPWAVLAVSIPAGFGAPLILAAAVNACVTIIKAIGESSGKKP